MDDRTDAQVISDQLEAISAQLAEIIKYLANINAAQAQQRDVLNAILRKRP
jgi:hypothetical protein